MILASKAAVAPVIRIFISPRLLRTGLVVAIVRVGLKLVLLPLAAPLFLATRLGAVSLTWHLRSRGKTDITMHASKFCHRCFPVNYRTREHRALAGLAATFLTQSQVGKTISVKASYTDFGDTAASVASAATALVASGSGTSFFANFRKDNTNAPTDDKKADAVNLTDAIAIHKMIFGLSFDSNNTALSTYLLESKSRVHADWGEVANPVILLIANA